MQKYPSHKSLFKEKTGGLDGWLHSMWCLWDNRPLVGAMQHCSGGMEGNMYSNAYWMPHTNGIFWYGLESHGQASWRGLGTSGSHGLGVMEQPKFLQTWAQVQTSKTIATDVAKYLEEFKHRNLQTPKNISQPHHDRPQWRPPRNGWCKINVDGAVFMESICCGIGMVIRNERGKIMGH